jgi:hypothetical protein
LGLLRQVLLLLLLLVHGVHISIGGLWMLAIERHSIVPH